MLAFYYIGLILGFSSIFFGFVAILLYFKVRKLISLLAEEQIEAATPFIQKQYKRIKTFLLICTIIGITGLICMGIWFIWG